MLANRKSGTPTQGLISLSNGSKIQIFDLRSGPSGLSKESETRWNGRFVVEATNIDPHSQFFPTVCFDKMLQHVYQRHTMQRIIWLWLIRHRILRQVIKYHVPRSTKSDQWTKCRIQGFYIVDEDQPAFNFLVKTCWTAKLPECPQKSVGTEPNF